MRNYRAISTFIPLGVRGDKNTTPVSPACGKSPLKGDHRLHTHPKPQHKQLHLQALHTLHTISTSKSLSHLVEIHWLYRPDFGRDRPVLQWTSKADDDDDDDGVYENGSARHILKINK